MVLESKVRGALGSPAVNKARGCTGVPVELFKTLKDDAIKVLQKGMAFDKTTHRRWTKQLNKLE